MSLHVSGSAATSRSMMIDIIYSDNMDKRIAFSVLTSIFLISAFSLIFIQPASSGYYEADDGLYGDAFWDEYDSPILNQYSSVDSNQVVVEFHEDGSFDIDVSDYDLAVQLYGCIYGQTLDPNSNVTTLKNELSEICQKHGISNPEITVRSPYGEDTFIYICRPVGISMNPTIMEGDKLVVNKTHDIHVGDIVHSNYPTQRGGIIKRVGEIKGDEVYLISDNVNGSYVKDGQIYDYEGLRAWVNMSDIQGEVIDIDHDDWINTSIFNV